VLAVGLVLCFLGFRSLHLAVGASGFALGWLLAEGPGAAPGIAALVGLAAALGVRVVVMLVLRAALFFVGAIGPCPSLRRLRHCRSNLSECSPWDKEQAKKPPCQILSELC
jgi:hypothetical protein